MYLVWFELTVNDHAISQILSSAGCSGVSCALYATFLFFAQVGISCTIREIQSLNPSYPFTNETQTASCFARD